MSGWGGRGVESQGGLEPLIDRDHTFWDDKTKHDQTDGRKIGGRD